jgi:hypothetical protein
MWRSTNHLVGEHGLIQILIVVDDDRRPGGRKLAADFAPDSA